MAVSNSEMEAKTTRKWLEAIMEDERERESREREREENHKNEEEERGACILTFCFIITDGFSASKMVMK